jgi:hypothetical protein
MVDSVVCGQDCEQQQHHHSSSSADKLKEQDGLPGMCAQKGMRLNKYELVDVVSPAYQEMPQSCTQAQDVHAKYSQRGIKRAYFKFSIFETYNAVVVTIFVRSGTSRIHFGTGSKNAFLKFILKQ